ncbi:hypothetical protein [Halochromatium glycolicum]|uniref:Sulfotransferase n=1 Tax=Halochromatium glycolicum TaxID=85075 RepID=A0AAJ0U7Q6_9GAMM|nr:hypothetical protein [Halochromatium glycolicum]MBK1706868.1 hypothetical protein [Halochromatium glycolicum]
MAPHARPFVTAAQGPRSRADAPGVLGRRRSHVFFLSIARGGSKWLTRVLEIATPVKARHEYLLNQDFFNGRAADKTTGSGFRDLVQDTGAVRRLLENGWTDMRLTGDVAEVNVHLPHVLDALCELFTDATLVHLHRHPVRIVASRMSR